VRNALLPHLHPELRPTMLHAQCPRSPRSNPNSFRFALSFVKLRLIGKVALFILFMTRFES
jgi:hypothetical protein